jgi:hypothetical protein
MAFDYSECRHGGDQCGCEEAQQTRARQKRIERQVMWREVREGFAEGFNRGLDDWWRLITNPAFWSLCGGIALVAWWVSK